MTVSVTIHPAAFTHLNGDTDPFNLEAKYVRVTWFESLASGTSGTITIPTGGTLVLDAFAGGVDCLVSSVADAFPTYETPLTAGGQVVAATLDSSGNWTLSGTPSAYPVALIYQYRVTLSDLDDTKMLGAVMADTSQDVSTGAIPTFGGVKLNGAETFQEIATPGNPASGYRSFYAKADGKLYTLDSAGTEAEVGGSSASGSMGSAVINFGAFPGSNEAAVTVTGQTGIEATSQVRAWVEASATSDHTASDAAYAAALVGVSTGSIVAGTGFTVYARSTEKMQGTFNIQWAWV